MGPCTSPKTGMLPGALWLPAALGVSTFFSPGDQMPHCESPNSKLCLVENIMEFGWEAGPTMPIPITLLELAMPIAPFCPLSLIHITLSCGIRANLCNMVSQKTKTVWIRGLHLQFADRKTWGQSFWGAKILFPCKGKTVRHPSAKEWRLCENAGNAAQPAATLWVWVSISHGQLVGMSCPEHRQLAGSWGERQTTSGKWWETYVYSKGGQKAGTWRKWRKLVGGSCSMFTKHWSGSYLPLHMGTQFTATANLHFNSYLLPCYFPADSSVL